MDAAHFSDRDQAAGLRQLMMNAPGRGSISGTLAVLGATPECGATTVACNLAAALVQQGNRVIYADEKRTAGEAPIWQLPYAAHWSQLAGMKGEEGLRTTASGVRLVAARPLAQGATPPPSQVAAHEIVVLDTCFDQKVLSDLAYNADCLLMVVAPTASGIKTAYATIKALHFLLGLQKLPVVVNARHESEKAALDPRLFANLEMVCHQYLGLSLQSIGNFPYDRHLSRQQALRQTVTEAFPRCPTATETGRLAREIGTGLRAAASARARPEPANPAFPSFAALSKA